MKAIVDGHEHVIVGEPTPLIIHGLFVPEFPVPELIEDYQGQIGDIYRANGRRCAAEVGSLATKSVGWIIGAGRNFIHDYLDKGGLFGPACPQESGQRVKGDPYCHQYLGIWMPKPRRQ